ncbi:AMP-binding protein [Pseudonocardia sp. RS11V-5]|uniref:AMP-binding protein n=1 Tax=Pseudonocardia terrae TaxID=2905831 RepID=UPI001E32FDAC|nr:AMP-binding protein [Pseudonocardia terrae]MCE3551183.1 AMP-binding protein [Pseudonocardia terrae]
MSLSTGRSSWAATGSLAELWEMSLGDLLRECAADHPDRCALVDADPDPARRRSWTYVELLATAERVAQALLSRFRPGERLAIWAPNCAEWVLLQQGASLAGLVLVTVNPANRRMELEYVLQKSRAAGIVHAPGYRGVDMAATVREVRAATPDLREAIDLADWDEFLASATGTHELPDVAPGDPAQIQYTSGTTGFPKGALLHHRGVLNASRLVARGAGATDGAVWVNAMPMFHIGGGALTEIGTFSFGGTYVLMPAFDAGSLLELIETYRGTITLLVPTMLTAVLAHPDLPTRDVSSLQTVMSGASFVPAELVIRTKETLGCRFTIVFGQTELHGVITQTALDDSPEDQSRTIGRPLPLVDVRIVAPGTDEVVPIGTRGEICARGYQTMLGYFEQPDDTALVFSDGWLRTGDLGTMDGRGYLTITGRLKDMIIRGGENIYPREVEDTLTAHPGVAEAAVVGVPDAEWGEQVGAVIVPVDHTTPPDPADLRAHCRARLAGFKAPSHWFIVDSLPTTPTGKVQKFVLRDRIDSGDLTGVVTVSRTRDDRQLRS